MIFRPRRSFRHPLLPSLLLALMLSVLPSGLGVGVAGLAAMAVGAEVEGGVAAALEVQEAGRGDHGGDRSLALGHQERLRRQRKVLHRGAKARKIARLHRAQQGQ